jgi:POT family proton-dependent oligopeptide transporter
MKPNAHSLSQPKALYLLAAVQMWECFSFYGMRALLVLYLINKLGFSDMRAYGTFALYSALVEFGGILGGRLADKFLGLRQSVTLGGWLIAAGHICMVMEENTFFLFMGLSLIVVGSGLFSTNISALLSMFYGKDDRRRERGFTLFFVGINIGALLASVLCGAAGELYGWHYGFGLAAIGMIIGNILLYTLGHFLEDKGHVLLKTGQQGTLNAWYILCGVVPLVAFMIAKEEIFIKVIPGICLAYVGYLGFKMWQSKLFNSKSLAQFSLYLGAFALFFAAEEQVGSSLLIFCERHASHTIAGFEIPTTSLLSINPCIIILGGAFVTKIFRSLFIRIVSALFIAALAFTMLSFACSQYSGSNLVPIAIVVTGILLVSIAEVFIAPAIYTYCSEMAPPEWQGVTMGMIPLGYSLAGLINGMFSKSMAIDQESKVAALNLYCQGFGWIGASLAFMALLLIFAVPILQKFLNKKEMSYDRNRISI